MGCIISREVASRNLADSEEKKEKSSECGDDLERKEADVAVVEVAQEEGHGHGGQPLTKEQRRKLKPNPRLSNLPKQSQAEQVAAGWPSWLTAVCGEALSGWIPRKADTFEKIDKIGQGTYSNVYKAKDILTGKVVALKKVRFDNLEPESVRFMAREILILRRLDHPNVVKLEGLVTSRMSCSLYLVFEYMEHDLAGLAANPSIKFTEAQVKCFMQQLLSGLEHCHSHRVLHRDIKGSNLLIDGEGLLKIADFGLATFFDPKQKHPLTNRVVTLWYRSPELLHGATHYGVGIDLWSAGCILAELLSGRAIMPGRTEVEQLHKIFKLCGSASDEYLKRAKLPNAALFRPREPYKRCIKETFKDFPPSSFPLIETLLAIDPAERMTATDALKSEFFTTEPYACEPSSLPKYPPSKEMDAKRRDDEARRSAVSKRICPSLLYRWSICIYGGIWKERNERTFEDERRRLITHANAKSKSEKFPPPHQDGALGFTLGYSRHIDPAVVPSDVPFSSTSFGYPNELDQAWSGPLVQSSDISAQRQKHLGGDEREQQSSVKGKKAA
ncbi:putative serine/threonine-protein kinase [Cucumis melo var. makuwa]|uniref:Serine/threonine-protein kinase n=1 Tax=Cucumis melo var. makuwa TaxID=1194695 RepID=A0A5D3D4B1_CUCMM|nr:putative serine/threonine-protein kinase [Cucumis melo var. makuwa]TYK18389.1 putative serine/threonine-protein kinase [Cucumis melo var. makuwa]